MLEKLLGSHIDTQVGRDLLALEARIKKIRPAIRVKVVERWLRRKSDSMLYYPEDVVSLHNSLPKLHEPIPFVPQFDLSRFDMKSGSRTRMVVLLNKEQQHYVFVKYNYERRMLAYVCKRFRYDNRRIEEIVGMWLRIMRYENDLVNANCGLVMSMAKMIKRKRPTYNFSELCSHNMITLLNSVRHFNPGRGYQFSTYACRSMLNVYRTYEREHSGTKFNYKPDIPMPSDLPTPEEHVDGTLKIMLMRKVVSENLAKLSKVEHTIIRLRWMANNPATLEEVGRVVGVTKERVRQVQLKALVKLREYMERHHNDFIDCEGCVREAKPTAGVKLYVQRRHKQAVTV